MGEKRRWGHQRRRSGGGSPVKKRRECIRLHQYRRGGAVADGRGEDEYHTIGGGNGLRVEMARWAPGGNKWIRWKR